MKSAVLATLFAAYALIVLHAFLTTGPQVNFPPTSDTIAYIRMATLPIFQLDFVAGERAFIYALFLKMTGKNLAIAGYIQTVISTACWGYLAWASLALFKTKRGKALGFGMVLLVALREEIIMWNSISLSESLSLSFFALWIGSWIMFAQGRTWFWRYFPLLTSFVFAFVRDSNAFLVLGAAILLAIVCALRLTAPGNIIISLVLASFFIGSLTGRSLNIRTAFALQNVIGVRILVDERRIAEFREHGMPGGLSPSDKAFLAGRCGNDFHNYVKVLGYLGRPGILNLIAWENSNGPRDYLAFLVRHPDYLLLEPFREDGVLRILFPLAHWVEPRECNPPLRSYIPPGFYTLLPHPVRLVLNGEPPVWMLLFWAFAAIANVFLYARHRPFRQPLFWTLVLLLASIPYLLVTWHGDGMDVSRHALLVGVQVHLAFAIGFALALDAFGNIYSTVKKSGKIGIHRETTEHHQAPIEGSI